MPVPIAGRGSLRLPAELLHVQLMIRAATQQLVVLAALDDLAIHTTGKRLIGVQRALKAEGKDYRAFEILNLGKYERQHYIDVNPNLRAAEQQKQLEEKEAYPFDSSGQRAWHFSEVPGT